MTTRVCTDFGVTNEFYQVGEFANTESLRDFPGGPVVKTAHFHCRGCRFDPWSGN